MPEKIKVKSIVTGSSELREANNKSFDSWSAANAWMLATETGIMREKQEGKRYGAYKTDFTIEFEDGNTYQGRYDIGDGELSFSRHVKGFCETYSGRVKPSHLTDEQWNHFKEECVDSAYGVVLDGYDLGG